MDLPVDELSDVIQTKYRIFEQIGEGSFGRVFRAEKRHSTDHKQYAIKFIKPRYDADEEAAKGEAATETGEFSYKTMMGLSAETMSELSLLARLKHPNVIRMEEVLYDATGHTLEMVLELADCDLRQLIRTWWGPGARQRKQTQVPQMVRIAYQVFCGLNYLHQNNILHLDVKPQNVLVVGGVAKIADFGLSEREQGTRESGQNKVTWPYRSPELQCNLGRYSADADTWSVGMMLVEMFFQHTIMTQKAPEYDDYTVDPSLFHAILQTVGTPPARLMKAYGATGRRCSAPDPSTFAPASGSAQYLDLEKTMLGESEIPYYKELYTPRRYRAILDLIHACLRFEPTDRISFHKIKEHPLFADDVDGCTCETVRGFHLPNNEHYPLPYSVERLLRYFGTTPALIRYAREIFKRVEQKDPGLLQNVDERRKFACACVSIAAKLLRIHDVYDLHAAMSLHAANTTPELVEKLAPDARSRKWAELSESLHQLEGACGRLLSWNFDGPWHATAEAAEHSALSSSSPKEVIEDQDGGSAFASLRATEESLLPLNSFPLLRQRDITSSSRECFVDWMVTNQMEWNLSQKTLFLSVQTLDRFLAIEPVLRTNLKLVATAVMASVSRRMELDGPEIANFEGLDEMETRVDEHVLGLKEPPLAIDFFVPLARICDVKQGSETWFLAMYYAELALLKYKMLGFEASKIAASAFYLATNTVCAASHPTWTPHQREQTGYTLEQLTLCVNLMYTTIESNQKKTTSFAAIRTKYEDEEFGSVSKLTCIKLF